MINTWLILLLVALSAMFAGLAHIRPPTGRSLFAWAMASIICGGVGAVLTAINWAAST